VKAFVLDCSATVPWIFGSEATRESETLLDALAAGGTAWVPTLWHLELALRRGLPLATRDRALAEALRQAGGKTVAA
jgi:predicted nucleic acid-binding protein